LWMWGKVWELERDGVAFRWSLDVGEELAW